LEKKRFFRRELHTPNNAPRNKRLYFRDAHSGGSLIAVRQGSQPLTEGIQLVATHSDSPCLRLKSQPVRLNTDAMENFSYLGIRLATVPHGGICVHQWPGTNVKVVGLYWPTSQGKPREIELEAIVAESSAHLRDRSSPDDIEGFTSPDRALEIVTSYTSVPELLKGLHFTSIDDFATSQLFAVPTNNTMYLPGERLLAGYGHDARSSLNASLQAFLGAEGMDHTIMLYISGNEEVGDPTPLGNKGPFLDNVLEYLFSNESLTSRQRSIALQRSTVVYTDVDTAPGGQEDPGDYDFENAPRVGFGAQIDAWTDYTTSPAMVRALKELAMQGKSRNNHLTHQVRGNSGNQNRTDLWFNTQDWGTLAKFGGIGGIRIPCVATHGHNEIISLADMYAAYMLTKRFYETPIDPTRFGKK